MASSGCISRALWTFLVVDEEVNDEYYALVKTLSVRLTIFEYCVENCINNCNRMLLKLSSKIVIRINNASQLNDYH